MASTNGAKERIKYLLTGGEYRATPDTIDRCENGICSYGMEIIRGIDGKRFVTEQYGVSVTTDRHIRAAHEAVAELGYVEQKPRVELPGHSDYTFTVYPEPHYTEWSVYVVPRSDEMPV